MFGWEFPPFNSGGLGTACYGMTKGLSNQGIDVTFVLPKGPSHMLDSDSHVNLVLANQLHKANLSKITKVKIKGVDSMLVPYIGTEEYQLSLKRLEILNKRKGNSPEGEIYGKNLFEEVHRFAEKAQLLVQLEDFDVIHAHDWMTYPAAIIAKEESNKPLVVHIHATEFDRTGGNPNQYVYDIEREGMQKADKVIAVSEFTKNMVVAKYGVNPDKIEVVHNAVELHCHDPYGKIPSFDTPISDTDKIVLFLGRITIQKGPDYFVSAARKVCDFMDNVKFVVTGSGDMESKMIEQAAELGLSDKFIFTGFVRGNEVDRMFRMADLYVMPSVSEPFGLTPLEAIKNNTPTIISKQSGVSEVLTHSLKVDFWDVDQIANKIVATLSHDSLSETLIENGRKNLSEISWNASARKMINVYKTVI